jgi:large subunit ribosomal protein L15
MTIINIDTLNDNFADGDYVDLAAMKEKGLIGAKYGRIKVLARGYLNKALKVEADAFSMDAIKMIILTGGEPIKLESKK